MNFLIFDYEDETHKRKKGVSKRMKFIKKEKNLNKTIKNSIQKEKSKSHPLGHEL